MTNEALEQLIELCRAGKCAIELKACQTGIVATVSSNRGDRSISTSKYIDSNQTNKADTLKLAVETVQ